MELAGFIKVVIEMKVFDAGDGHITLRLQ